jgi:hypothetical protein
MEGSDWLEIENAIVVEEMSRFQRASQRIVVCSHRDTLIDSLMRGRPFTLNVLDNSSNSSNQASSSRHVKKQPRPFESRQQQTISERGE